MRPTDSVSRTFLPLVYSQERESGREGNEEPVNEDEESSRVAGKADADRDEQLVSCVSECVVRSAR